MSTPANTDNPNATTETALTIESPDLSFSDYERIRRGEEVKVAPKQSAPEPKPAQEQKKSAKSDHAETEEEEEDQADETHPEEGEGEEKRKKKGGFQRRIDKLNARYAEERQRREALEQKLAEREQKAPKDAKESKSEEGKPNPDKFETHAEYVEALADWKIEQREKAREAKERDSKLSEEKNKLLKSHEERLGAFREKTKDFGDVIEAAIEKFGDSMSPAVEHAVLNSENGPELLYELAKDHKEYERVNKLEPYAAAREIGKLEAKIELKKSSIEEKKPETKTITKAPKPIEPLGSAKATTSKSLDDPNLSFSDYEKLRREQMNRKRR